MHPETIISAGMRSKNITKDEVNKLECFTWYWNDRHNVDGEACAEPGYQTDHEWVVTGDFNATDFDKKTDFNRVVNLIERIAEIEWDDQWTTCEDCGRLVRTSGDCWGWTPHFYIFGGHTLICMECIKNDEDMLEDYLEEIKNDSNKAVHEDIKPEDHGWDLHEACLESGWHPGQNDDPRSIGKELEEDGVDFLFQIDSVGMFDVRFKVFTKKVEEEMWHA